MFKFIIVLAFLAPLSSHAKMRGSIKFSKAEKRRHLKNIKETVDIAEKCLRDTKKEHLKFYKKTCAQGKCFSKFIGNRRYSKKRNQTRRDGHKLTYLGDALKAAGIPQKYFDVMTPTSCIDLAMTCLGKGFVATGQAEAWKRIDYFTNVTNLTYGKALFHSLQLLGWKLHYWNPTTDKSVMAKWHDEELGPVVGPDYKGRTDKVTVNGETVLRGKWESIGYHLYRYNNVMRRNMYYDNKVDVKNTMVGFGNGTPRILNSTPFWVGMANTGYHIFPGTYRDVIEAHSTRHITSRDNMEFSEFAPMAPGGGPRWSKKEKYRSGLIAIPPR